MNSDPQITVSAIIIVFNDEKFIARAIKSVLAQSYPNIEIIVVDDGSSDHSLSIAKSFEKQGVKVFSKENGGSSSARNYGVLRSSGQYIAFLDSDDVWIPGKIETMVCSIKNHDVLNCVYSSFHFVDQVLNVTGGIRITRDTNAYDEILHFRNIILPSTMMLSREAYDRVGHFPERVRVYEDGIFSLLVAKHCNTIPIEDYLTLYLHSSGGQGRRSVYNYEESVSKMSTMLLYAKEHLSQKEFETYQQSAWSNEFCKFAMYKQFSSARRLRRERDLPLKELGSSLRGVLAIASAYSGLGILSASKFLYAFFARCRARVGEARF